MLLLLTSLWGCRKEDNRIKPEVKPITESVYASGTVKAEEQYNVYTDVSGILEKAFVAEGDTVERAQPLFLVKNQTSALNTENARLALALSKENIEDSSGKLKELSLALGQAKEQLALDSALYARQQNLWKENIGTKVTLEQRELAYKTAKANYLSALTRYKQTKAELNTQYEQAKNNLEINRELEGNFVVKSEIDGLVYGILKEPGELLTAQTPIAIVGKSDSFYLDLQIDEYDIVKVQVGQKVLVAMDSYKGQVFEAVVRKVLPIMNEQSRTFTVEANFTRAPKVLYPNLTVEANIVIRTKDNALIIPRAYLVDGLYVMTEPDEKSKVETGMMDYEHVEILQGLDSTTYIYKP